MTNPSLFLVGCTRSGTTLLERIVDAHPQITIVPYGRGLTRRFENRDGLTPEGFITPELAQDPHFSRFMSREELAELIHELMQAGGPVSYATLISHIAERYGKTQGKPVVAYTIEATGHKVPNGMPRVEMLHSLWPEAKIVHLIRDGRDVCMSVNSWRKAPSLAGRFSSWNDDPVTTAALWWEWQVRLKREEGTPLGPKLYYEIRYEALVTHPQDECRAMCEFLGIPYDDAMLRFHEGREKNDAGLDAKHAWRPVTPGLRNWQKEMPYEDQQRFEAAAGELLDELGYPRGVDRLPVEALEHAYNLRKQFEGRPLPRHWGSRRAELASL